MSRREVPEIAGQSGSARASASLGDPARGPRPAPGLEALLHPMPLAALAVLLVNDHVLKPTYPGLLSGKLSGIAVLVLLPFFLLAAWEVARMARPGLRSIDPGLVAASVALTMASYVAIEVLPPASELYRMGLGIAQWPFRAFAAAVASNPLPAVAPVVLTSDPTDLLVVPFGLLVLVVGPWSGRGARLSKDAPTSA